MEICFGIESFADEVQMCVKIFRFKCVYFGQPVSENSVFQAAYIHKQMVKTMISYNASYLDRVNVKK